jgi:hypothetical protein
LEGPMGAASLWPMDGNAAAPSRTRVEDREEVPLTSSEESVEPGASLPLRAAGHRQPE